MLDIGARVGRYVVHELLGSGGMGAVYAATDERLGRRVALKVIRSDRRLEPESRARFLREARILSQLEHPNVCRLYELLEADEESYLVLELIRGQSLREALRQPLDPRRRMEIALQVAAALVAAHERGIVHRDLKPDNVLLAADGTVKVLDFGIARSLDEELPATLAAGEPGEPLDPSGRLRTRQGKILGTAGYMSPEQARGESITAASDMYSFGLLLQELFTGEPPFERGVAQPALVARAAIGETLPLAGLHPDLTALIRRLQSLAPGGRPSAADARERLLWIRDRPARQRRRALAGAAVALLAAMAVGMSLLAWRVAREAERANQQAMRAGAAAAAANEVSRFLVEVFAVADPSEARGSSVTARELLDSGAARIDEELAQQPLVQARLMDAMGRAYQQLGLYDDASRLLAGALSRRERRLAGTDPELIESLNHYGVLLHEQGRLDAAAKVLERAVAAGERGLPALDRRRVTSLTGLGIVRWNQANYGEAERLYRRALDLLQRIPGVAEEELAANLDNLAILLKDTARFAEAEPLYRRALELRERRRGPRHPEVARSLHNLAELLRQQGRTGEAMARYTRALSIWEETVGPQHPAVAGTLITLGAAHTELRQWPAAERAFERALTVIDATLGRDHEWAGYALQGLGELAQQRGRYAEAEGFHRRALPVLEAAVGADHPAVAELLVQLAAAQASLGRSGDAATALERAVAILAAREPPSPELPRLRARLAELRGAGGQGT